MMRAEPGGALPPTVNGSISRPPVPTLSDQRDLAYRLEL
jgi:hypothetical protein